MISGSRRPMIMQPRSRGVLQSGLVWTGSTVNDRACCAIQTCKPARWDPERPLSCPTGQPPSVAPSQLPGNGAAPTAAAPALRSRTARRPRVPSSRRGAFFGRARKLAAAATACVSVQGRDGGDSTTGGLKIAACCQGAGSLPSLPGRPVSPDLPSDLGDLGQPENRRISGPN